MKTYTSISIMFLFPHHACWCALKHQLDCIFLILSTNNLLYLSQLYMLEICYFVSGGEKLRAHSCYQIIQVLVVEEMDCGTLLFIVIICYQDSTHALYSMITCLMPFDILFDLPMRSISISQLCLSLLSVICILLRYIVLRMWSTLWFFYLTG